MGVLETLDVLRDARVVGPPAERGGEEGDDVGGFKAAAATLEASEKVSDDSPWVCSPWV